MLAPLASGVFLDVRLGARPSSPGLLASTRGQTTTIEEVQL